MFSVEKRAGKRGKLRDLLTGTGNGKRMSLEKSENLAPVLLPLRNPKMAAQPVSFGEFCFALLRKMSSSASDWHCGIQNCFNILVMEY